MTAACSSFRKQAVIDEDARELRADRLIEQRRGDRRIDAAGQAADDAVVADPLAHLRRSFRSAKSPSFHVPVQPQTSVRKLRSIVAAERRVRHLGMELHAEDRQRLVLDRGDRAGRRRGQRHEVVRRRASTWSPWLIQTSNLLGHAGEQVARLRDVAAGPAELAGRDVLDLAAERLAGELHAVADAEHRNAELKDRRIALAARRLRRRSPARRRGSAPAGRGGGSARP